MNWRERLVAAFIAAYTLLGITSTSRAADRPRSFDHVYIIVLENHSFDDALFGPAAFLRQLAQTQGLATFYFGVSHPSLPNYLAMIAGDDFGIRDDHPSCFASGLAKDAPRHALVGETLVDQLEAAGRSWSLYAEGLPEVG
jgi:phospholipase C